MLRGKLYVAGHRVICDDKEGLDGQIVTTYEIACPWSQKDFVAEARKIVHPFDRKAELPFSVGVAIINAAKLGPSEMKSKRRATLKRIKARGDELIREEQAIHSSLR